MQVEKILIYEQKSDMRSRAITINESILAYQSATNREILLGALDKPKKVHKYNAKAVVIDGVRFPSKRQARYYTELLIRQKASEVNFFLMEVPFQLPGNVKYRVDFAVFLTNGQIEWIDVKGFETQLFIAKKKMVEAIYGIEIKIIK